MSTVSLGGDDVALAAPTSTASRWDVYSAATSNANRAFAAALGLCWQGKGKPKTRLAAHKFEPLSYGGAVLDELVERGITVPEILGAGLRAWQLCGDGLITAQEVEEVEGFSGGEEE